MKEPSLPPASAEFGRLSEQMQIRDSTMDISGTIHIYDQERDGMLKEVKPFRFVRVGTGYFAELSSLRTYCDGKLVLVVDTANRDMEVYKYVANGSQDITARMMANHLFNDTASLRFTGNVRQKGSERVLAVHSDYNPEIKVYRVYYDTANYRLRRVEVEWWKDRRGVDTIANHIWLAKLDYSYRPRGIIDIPAYMRRFIIIGAGGVKPTADYADYRLTVNF